MKTSNYVPVCGWTPLTSVAKWPLLGVELEIEVEDDYENDDVEQLDDLLEEKYKNWLVTKSDSTLDNGIELVTVPMTFYQHSQKWPSVLKLLGTIDKVKVNDNTGLHIHIETPELPPIRTNNVLIKNRHLIESIAGRFNSDHCEWPYENNYHENDNRYINDDHHGVLNRTNFSPKITPTNHVYEFRAPQATINLKEFCGRVQLPVALTEFVLNTNYPVNQFQNFIKEYPYIKAII